MAEGWDDLPEPPEHHVDLDLDGVAPGYESRAIAARIRALSARGFNGSPLKSSAGKKGAVGRKRAAMRIGRGPGPTPPRRIGGDE